MTRRDSGRFSPFPHITPSPSAAAAPLVSQAEPKSSKANQTNGVVPLGCSDSSEQPRAVSAGPP